MSSLPDVSVVLPVYNAGNGVVRAIASLQNQSGIDIEIIIVNDASTDNTLDVVKDIASSDEKIIVIDLHCNVGVHEARLCGVSRARGDWIGFLDADDYSRSSMYKTMLEKGSQNNVDLVICGSDRVDSDRRFIEKKVFFRKDRLVTQDLFEEFSKFRFGTGALWNKLYRSSLIKPLSDFKYPWRQPINEDLLWNLEIFRRAESVYLVSDVLHEYVYSRSSVTYNMNPFDSHYNTLLSFAVASEKFRDLSSSEMDLVVDLHLRQLDDINCPLSDIVMSEEKKNAISKATSVLLANYPEGLAKITCRNNGDSLRSVIKKFYVGMKGVRRWRI